MDPSLPVRVRSWLFTPATRPDRFDKAAECGADVCILDLQESVQPAHMAKARGAALAYLAQPAAGPSSRALRINGLDRRFGLADLQALLESSARPDYLILPKTESAAHLEILDRLLAEAGRATRLVALIESAPGLTAVEEIVDATPRLEAHLRGQKELGIHSEAPSGMGSPRRPRTCIWFDEVENQT